MFNKRHRRGGFTLPEVLVTIAIVAILAAVVVPAVTQQISKGDQGQLTSSVDGIQTGLTSFVADVRKFPIALSNLTVQSADLDSTIVPLGHLTATEAARWAGPYVQTDILGPSGGIGSVVSIGFGLSLMDTLRKGTNNFLIAKMSSPDSASVERADVAVDGGDGKDKGRIRWSVTTATFDSAWVQLITAR